MENKLARRKEMVQKSEMSARDKSVLKRNLAIKFSSLPLLIMLLVALPAGTFNYWQVYAYMATLVIPMTFVIFFFMKHDPKFLERRTRPKEKEQQQKAIVALASLTFVSSWVISGLDKRFSWSQIPVIVVLIADFIIFLGSLMIIFVFKQNSYASRIVEVDENQKVMTTGLYSIIRHPMYAAILIVFMPAPIALGSYWGLIPYIALPVILVRRIITEEAMLIKQLPGYQEYCMKTKHRFIPFIW